MLTFDNISNWNAYLLHYVIFYENNNLKFDINKAYPV